MAFWTIVREHAATPLRLRAQWAAAGGLAGGIATGLILAYAGILAALGGGSLVVGWLVHLVASIGLALPLVVLVDAPRPKRGVVWGATYGLVLGAIGWSLVTMTLLPELAGVPPAAGLALLQGGWGALLGLVYGWGLERTEGVMRPRNRAARRHPRGAP